jgi:hypothetical protein
VTPDVHAVTGAPRILLRVEGAAVLVVATMAYAHTGRGWLLYLLLFFVPDVSFAAYALGPRIGAFGYNLLHSYALPLLALAAALAGRATGADVAVQVPWWGWHDITGLAAAVSLVWLAHIGFDRMLGYGLKYPTGFKDTHLGRL